MNVLVVGSGGREHSIVKKLVESNQVANIYVAPGNGGMNADATCVPINETEIDDLVAFAKESAIDWTIVGPEVPLMNGIVDAFQIAGLKAFGPTKEAAIIEGSKDFAKSFMKRHHIPTANYETFTDCDKAKAYIKENGAPIVIKADGLAAGKGVFVATTVEQAIEAVESMLLDNQFGGAGNRVVIEEFLDGEEFTLMAFVNGENVYPLLSARDHKRAFDNDKGPNTGGMGAFAPVPDLDQSVIRYTVEHILEKAAKGMVLEGRPFTGILYGGIIETSSGPKVIEFNARFGDPETQVVLPLLENDFIQVIEDVSKGKDPKLNWKEGYAIGAVVASKGYPGKYAKQVPLPYFVENDESYVVHAGTKVENNGTYQAIGGRVLLVGSVQQTIEQAHQAVYNFLRPFEQTNDFFFRSDIGK
ncbi:Phosphoribosylamine--glycine ligase [Paraliobacillus sp. PM-2]|uniref:phosphoribosylamine--glycine ligase n=1 Tax=Paraliobacillus sp. PM-2 TaxID=1462524 RepID=UPI00061CC95E|nr:phosphoribosylamine--glycine ligase [Paraliobacillus sp. PM-2]CQR47348.1 Phosphoribosylamine--glycine ligase [Paraliobacillus sp. PM-2]